MEYYLFEKRLAPQGRVNNLSTITCKSCFRRSRPDLSHMKMWKVRVNRPVSRLKLVRFFFVLFCFLTTINTPHSFAFFSSSHHVYITVCGFLLVILSPDWQEQLARQRLHGCIPLLQFLSLLPLNSHFHGAALVRTGRMTMSLIFKGVRLVNAFISMCTTESIICALLHSSNKLLHNFHTNLLFYSHYFDFFFYFFHRECFFVLCSRWAVGSEIRLELARIQCLAQRHWVTAAVGLEPSYSALQPLTLTVHMNFKVSALHGIFLSCTFVLGFS